MLNPVMKTLQVLIYGYFQQLRVLGSPHGPHIGQVANVSAASKLRVRDAVLVEATRRRSAQTDASSYRDKKASGIATARAYLGREVLDGARWLGFMEDQPKRDDLCDSFLLAIAFAQRAL